MADPIFWLGLSMLLVAVSLTAVLMAALPAFLELARAARSAEKLFDTLNRELPPTLEAIRLTGIEITNLSDDVSQNVQNAGRIVDQIDQSISGVKQQARQAQVTTRSLVAGFRAAWETLKQPTLAQDIDPEPDSEAAATATPQLNRAVASLNLPQPNRNRGPKPEPLPYPQPIAEPLNQPGTVASAPGLEAELKTQQKPSQRRSEE
ncbi:hypothetical protein [Leptolyngbya sp. NK1-12]|uniref:hypothetical protein n=1 Tax=Leptolyngbya sp. NK1-12 TaxID=2547451 RepID=UPI002930B0BA|nr:hypothetical protein [Leptolyngbya sp. NK1-12]